MGFIRGGFAILVGAGLFFTFFAIGTFLSISMSLSYDNVQPELEGIAETEHDLTNNINENYGEMQSECQVSDVYIYEVEAGDSFEIPCSVVGEGEESIVGYSVKNYVDETYYKSYDCDYWDCFKEQGPLFLVSNESQQYWQGKFLFALVVALLLIGLMFLLVHKKENLFIYSGVLLGVAALPFLKIGALLSWVFNFALSITGNVTAVDLPDSAFSQIPWLFFSRSVTVFWIMFFIGLVFVALGIAIKAFKFGSFVGKALPAPKEKLKKKKEVVNRKKIKELKQGINEKSEALKDLKGKKVHHIPAHHP